AAEARLQPAVAAARRRPLVAGEAGGLVEHRSQAVGDRLLLRECHLARVEEAQLVRQETGERIPEGGPALELRSAGEIFRIVPGGRLRAAAAEQDGCQSDGVASAHFPPSREAPADALRRAR